MNIEVTQKTFYKVINGTTDFLNSENLESAKKRFYYNELNKQRGIIIINFSSSKTITQYYLTDINA